LETYHYRRASARTNSSGNALAAYPIDEVTGSSPVLPTLEKRRLPKAVSFLFCLHYKTPTEWVIQVDNIADELFSISQVYCSSENALF
jgi:hypothetical protein